MARFKERDPGRFGRAYRQHVETYGFCPVEASSEGYQGQALMPHRFSLHHLLADHECPVCGALPINGCGCSR